MSSETAWLIEHPHDPRYGRESWYAGVSGFSTDSLQAIRYARREDALKVIGGFPVNVAKNLIATDHAWCGPTPGIEEMYPMSGQSFAPVPEANFRSRVAPRCQSCDAKQAEINRQTKRADQFLDLLSERDSRYATERDALLKERDEQTNHAIRVNRDEAGQAGYDRALQDIGYTVSVGMIAAERRRQVEGESWTSAHDDGHDAGQIALAAACYAIESAGRGSVEYRLGHSGGIEINVDAVGLYWPFDRDWWKPGNPIRNLVKAGALIAAEIDRRLRAGEEP